MKRLVKIMLTITVGIIIIPALFAFALGLGGTIIGFMNCPEVMSAVLRALGIVSIPGIIIGLIAMKR